MYGPLVFVANPIEADLPSHWIPLSILKRAIELRKEVPNSFAPLKSGRAKRIGKRTVINRKKKPNKNRSTKHIRFKFRTKKRRSTNCTKKNFRRPKVTTETTRTYGSSTDGSNTRDITITLTQNPVSSTTEYVATTPTTIESTEENSKVDPNSEDLDTMQYDTANVHMHSTTEDIHYYDALRLLKRNVKERVQMAG